YMIGPIGCEAPDGNGSTATVAIVVGAVGLRSMNPVQLTRLQVEDLSKFSGHARPHSSRLCVGATLPPSRLSMAAALNATATSCVTWRSGESSMNLRINLVLLAVAAIVVELFAAVSTPFLENIARADVLQRARIMMEAAAGIRTYTSNEIAPLLTART